MEEILHHLISSLLVSPMIYQGFINICRYFSHPDLSEIPIRTLDLPIFPQDVENSKSQVAMNLELAKTMVFAGPSSPSTFGMGRPLCRALFAIPRKRNT